MDKTIYSQNYVLFLRMLREAREQSGLTQGDVAERLEVTQSFVSKCERGERRLDIVELRAWCVALELPLHQFLQRFEEASIRKS